jgi:predicted  nucleic acid-binding Zn-ribbon protein
MNIAKLQAELEAEQRGNFDLDILKEELDNAQSYLDQAKDDRKRAKRMAEEAEDDIDHWQGEVNRIKEEIEDKS